MESTRRTDTQVPHTKQSSSTTTTKDTPHTDTTHQTSSKIDSGVNVGGTQQSGGHVNVWGGQTGHQIQQAGATPQSFAQAWGEAHRRLRYAEDQMRALMNWAGMPSSSVWGNDWGMGPSLLGGSNLPSLWGEFDSMSGLPSSSFQSGQQQLPAGTSGSQQQLVPGGGVGEQRLAPAGVGGGLLSSAFNVQDQPDKYIITANVPGWKPDELKVDIQGRDLVMSGEKRIENKDDRSQSSSYNYFKQSYRLPPNFQPDDLNATFVPEQQALRVEVKKPQQQITSGRHSVPLRIQGQGQGGQGSLTAGSH